MSIAHEIPSKGLSSGSVKTCDPDSNKPVANDPKTYLALKAEVGREELPVILQYLVYSNSVKAMCTNLRNHFICLDGRPLTEDQLSEITDGVSLMDAFLYKLFELTSVLEGGRFVVQSSSCDYCDFARQCRNPMSLLKLEGDYD